MRRLLVMLLIAISVALPACGATTGTPRVWTTPAGQQAGGWSYDVILHWSGITFASRTGYYVTRNGARADAAVDARSYTFTALLCGARYLLHVQPHDAAGHVGRLFTARYVAPACKGPKVNYYVSQNGGNPANGATCAHAEPLSWLNTRTNWTPNRSAPIQPGTVIGLCGSLTAPSSQPVITAQGSGTAADPITIYWEPGASLSEAVCPGSGDGAPGCFDTNGSTYLTLDGGKDGSVLSTANGTHLANHDASADGVYAPNCTGCTIENLNISDMYVEGFGSNDCTASNAIGLWYTGSNTTVANNTFANEQVGSNLAYIGNTDTNMVIEGNAFEDDGTGMNWISDENGGNAGPVLFYGNTLSGFSLWDTSGACYHEDGIHGWTNGYPNVVNYSGGIYIYDNRWSGMDGVDTGYIYLEDSRGPNFSTPSSPIYVFNNVSSGIGNNGHIVVGTGTPFIANNTIMGGSSSNGSCIGYGVTGDEENETSENNAIEGCSTLAGVARKPFYAAGQPNYNLYADSSGGASFLCGDKFFALLQFSSWQSCVRSNGGGGPGAETHSARISTLLLNNDGSPRARSRTTGVGANLTKLCRGHLVPLCRELNGTPRPPTGPWDVGAY